MKLFKLGDKNTVVSFKQLGHTLRMVLSCLVLVLSLHASADDKGAAPAAASAEKKEDSDFVTEKRGDTTIKYKKKATYDFEGSSIEGMYNKPSGSYISNIKDVKGKSIIRIRENFDSEVIDSMRLLR